MLSGEGLARGGQGTGAMGLRQHPHRTQLCLPLFDGMRWGEEIVIRPAHTGEGDDGRPACIREETSSPERVAQVLGRQTGRGLRVSQDDVHELMQDDGELVLGVGLSLIKDTPVWSAVRTDDAEGEAEDRRIGPMERPPLDNTALLSGQGCLEGIECERAPVDEPRQQRGVPLIEAAEGRQAQAAPRRLVASLEY